jgi:tetratricopeptide (TPR) repeat protein
VFGPYHRSTEWNAFQMQVERAWSEHPFGTPAWVEAVRTVLLWQSCRKLSDLCLATGKLDDAVVYAREAIPLLPQEPISWSRLARALRLQGRLEESAEAYLTALEPAPLIELLWLELLPILRALGDARYDERLHFAANLARSCPSFTALQKWLAVNAPELP